MEGMVGGSSELQLPGFRFHPTEEELLDFYLRLKVNGEKLCVDFISTVHLYRHDPWELPGLAKIGEKEWYFYVPRDRRQSFGGRPSRTTERGFWKATGSDRSVRSAADPKRLIGLKKTLVYYEGRAPLGAKTDWIMNEYRFADDCHPAPMEDVVLCRIYRKATSTKELEQRAAASLSSDLPPSSTPAADSCSVWPCQDESLQISMTSAVWDDVLGIEYVNGEAVEVCTVVEPNEEASAPAGVRTTIRRPTLPELEVPASSGLEWLQQPFLTQLRSPWMDFWSPYYYSMLNC